MLGSSLIEIEAVQIYFSPAHNSNQFRFILTPPLTPRIAVHDKYDNPPSESKQFPPKPCVIQE